MKQYIPLMNLFIFSFLFSTTHYSGDSMRHMNIFMGYFLTLLAMLKLFDIQGFYNSFKKYDIISKNISIYGYLYPFLEAVIGFLFIFQCYDLYANIAAFIMMTSTLLGIFQHISSGKTISCACMGSLLQVPLSTISIIESGGMSVMAAINLYTLLSSS